MKAITTRLTDADPRSRYTEQELEEMRKAIQARTRAQPETRRERVLREALAADACDFPGFALRLDLRTWMEACRVRLAADDALKGITERTPAQWQEFDNKAQAMYASLCTYLTRQPPAAAPTRPDAGRLYRQEERP